MKRNAITPNLGVESPVATPYLEKSSIKHLHSRLGFGVSNTIYKSISNKTLQDYTFDLIDNAINLPLTPMPRWAHLDRADYTKNGFKRGNFFYLQEVRRTFTKELLTNAIRSRLMLFWHDLLVTNVDGYVFAGYAFEYFQILQKNCLGNFKTLINDIGKSGAMLLYLNGYENKSGSPNENYARELYELFTLGEGNGYTENDIKETARALTGFNKKRKGWGSKILFDSSTFDSDIKTIFGESGNWGYDDVIDILFKKRKQQIATYICSKIYKYFVDDKLDNSSRTIIKELETEFIQNNFNIAPVIKHLFTSTHFYSNEVKKTVIKSPYDLTLQFFNDTNFEYGDEEKFIKTLDFYTTELGQKIMYPPTVEGWEGDKGWINSGTYSLRHKTMRELVYFSFSTNTEAFRDFAINLSGNSSNPEEIVETIFNELMYEKPYSKDDFDNAVDVFKSRVPSNYFENGIWNLQIRIAPFQVYDLIDYIVTLPDYQLK